MQILPPEMPMKAQLKSRAEKTIHDYLKGGLRENWVAIYSAGIIDHEKKTFGEIDFLIISPQGLIALEVKGGRISQENGIWTYTNKKGKQTSKRESPFVQVKDNLFALNEYLFDKLPNVMSNVPFTWGVVMPDIVFKEESPEWDLAQVFDRNHTPNTKTFCANLDALLEWSQEQRRRKNKKIKPLSNAEISEIVSVIRPEFELLSPLKNLSGEIADRAIRATEEQYLFLDAVEGSDRLLCSGGAGTGKTFLAVESARREALAGNSVNVICRSPIVASFIEDQDGMEDDLITVAAFNQIEKLQKADCLIVDEGQDLMNIDDIYLLEEILEGGIEEGKWRIFYDQNHQAGILGNYDEDALNLLKGFSHEIKLPKNCRNTKQIIEEVENTLRVNIGKDGAGIGTDVVWDWWGTEEEGAKKLNDYLIGNLIGEHGIEPNKITVLGAGNLRENSLIDALPGPTKSKLEFLDTNNVTSPTRGKISVTRIDLFKGLENDFICVVGMPRDIEEEKFSSLLYVAMTRATSKLYLALPSSMQEKLKTLKVQ